MDFTKVPIGFGVALAQNKAAMARYAAMGKKQKREILSQAHNAQSEMEMNRIVDSIVSGGM